MPFTGTGGILSLIEADDPGLRIWLARRKTTTPTPSRLRLMGRSAARTKRGILLLAMQCPMGCKGWWSRTGSNRRPPACKAGALPTELRPLGGDRSALRSYISPSSLRILPDKPCSIAPPGCARRSCRQHNLVGLGRLELPTSRLSGVRSNHLSYRP